MNEVLLCLVKMISPILSFTAEEIWGRLPEQDKDAESVHLTKWFEFNDKYLNKELEDKWATIIKLRKSAK